jgi:hypothetical protein
VQRNRIRQSSFKIAHKAQSEKQGQSACGPRGSVWDRVQRIALTGFGALGTAALLGLAACPADLANPSDYDHPGSKSTAGAGAGGASGGGAGSGTGGALPAQPGLNVSTTCLTTIFAKSCSMVGCHAVPAAADLDLSSPNVNTRLIDVPATHESANPATGCIANQKLIDSTNPDMSWLVQKLSTDGKTCGLAMPIGQPLSDTDVACFKKYAQDVAAAAKAGGM